MSTDGSKGTVFHLRNVLVLAGILVTTVGLVYFATEFIDRLSDWGRAISLALLSVILVSLGRHVEISGEPTELVDKSGWRWLRVTMALYVLGLVAAFAGVIVFLSIDGVDRLLKAAVVIVLGLVVILSAGRFVGVDEPS